LFTLNDVVVLQGNRAKTRHQTAWQSGFFCNRGCCCGCWSGGWGRRRCERWSARRGSGGCWWGCGCWGR
jgi:hypothetical protein